MLSSSISHRVKGSNLITSASPCAASLVAAHQQRIRLAGPNAASLVAPSQQWMCLASPNAAYVVAAHQRRMVAASWGDQSHVRLAVALAARAACNRAVCNSPSLICTSLVIFVPALQLPSALRQYAAALSRSPPAPGPWASALRQQPQGCVHEPCRLVLP